MNCEECRTNGGFCSEVEVNENCWCTVNLVTHVPTFLGVAGAGAIGVAMALRTVVSGIFQYWLQPKYVKSTFVSNSGEDEGLTLPQTADVTAAYYGFPKEDWWRMIKKFQDLNNCGALHIEQIEEIFEPDNFWPVTNDIKYFLYQGTTSFRIKNEESQVILLVTGEWRGGHRHHLRQSCACGTIDSMVTSDAIQTIYVSGSDQESMKWVQKPPELRDCAEPLSPTRLTRHTSYSSDL